MMSSDIQRKSLTFIESHITLSRMAKQVSKYVPMPTALADKVKKIADREKRSIGNLLYVLVCEALDARERRKK